MTDASHPSAPDPAAGHEPSPRARQLVAIWAITAAMAAGTVGLILVGGRWDRAWFDAPWWLALLIAVGYAVAERYVFHVEFRRQAMSFSLSEVPTAYALAFLGPLAAVLVRVLAGGVVLLTEMRPRMFKFAFNVSLFALETALAFSIVGLFADRADDPGLFLVGVALGTAVSTAMGAFAVTLAIALFEGHLLRRLLAEAQPGMVVGPIAAMTAAVSLAPALFGIEYAALSVVPVVAVWLVLSNLGRLGQRHRDLEALHGFAGAIGGSLVLDEILPAALERSLGLLRGDHGAIVVFAHDGSVAASATVGEPVGRMPVHLHDVAWRWAVDLDAATWFQPDDGMAPRRDVPSRGLVVPLRSDETILGLLLVVDRTVTAATFGYSDLRRAASLGEQLAPAVARALMHTSMTHAALHDALTGDPNRLHFERVVRAAMGHGPGPDAAAVLMLDLDEFKDVNDTLGHHVGDRTLLEFATRTRALLAADDVFARFGGDEFAIFVRRPDVAAILDFAERLLADSHAPFALDGYDVIVPVSIGVAVITEDDREPASVLRRADIAMYVAKRRHTGVELYRDDIDRRTPERLALVADLREAIDGAEHQAGGLSLHFQPKVDLATSTVVGVEALCRWEHPTRGWVPPDEFIRIAEETGLIRRLTDHVVSAAIGTLRGWTDAGIDLTMAVNLSTLDLLDDALPSRIEQRLAEHAIAADRLVLEITESALMADSPRTMASIARLHELGVQLSLDDFGTGYSSLSYLRRLPVSELKIDRSFVANLVLDAHDEVIVRSTIDLGHNLGLRVVAEGVENDLAIERLRSLGCDLGQGFGFSRPLDATMFRRWLDTAPYLVRPMLRSVPRDGTTG